MDDAFQQLDYSDLSAQNINKKPKINTKNSKKRTETEKKHKLPFLHKVISDKKSGRQTAVTAVTAVTDKRTQRKLGKREEMQVVPLPGQKVFRWLFIYTFALVGIHQVLVTMLEIFTFRRFYLTLLIILGNALMTTLLILALEYIFIPISKKK